jgi:hypothetical protein
MFTQQNLGAELRLTPPGIETLCLVPDVEIWRVNLSAHYTYCANNERK